MLSVAWVAAGAVACLGWARVRKAWPFGSKQVREAYRELERDPG